jgi:HlyD family secretion protein
MSYSTRITLLLVAGALAMSAGCQRHEVSSIVGTLEWDRIELTADAAEPIIAIAAHAGETVAAGQVVLTLDARLAQAQLEQARARLDQQEAHLAEVQRGPRVEQIAQARARLAGANGNLTSAQNELNRVRPLVGKQLLSTQDLDKARADYDTALAARDAARAALTELENGSTREELDQAKGARDAAAATVRGQQVSLERLTVRAPLAGIIDDLPLKAGERPQAGAVVAVMLSGAAPYARIYLPEPLRAGIHTGSKATVRVDGITQPFHAHVRRINADPAFTPYFSLTEHDRSRLSYLTEIELEDAAAQKLPAGIPLQVNFDESSTGQ